MYSPSNREFVMNDLGHYLFQKTDYVIRRKVGHRIIVSCFGQRNMIYKFFINISDKIKVCYFSIKPQPKKSKIN